MGTGFLLRSVLRDACPVGLFVCLFPAFLKCQLGSFEKREIQLRKMPPENVLS